MMAIGVLGFRFSGSVRVGTIWDGMNSDGIFWLDDTIRY